MRRRTYAITYCVSNLVSVAVFLWLLADRISTGVAERLPAKSGVSYGIAIVAIVLTGGWWQVVRPRGDPRRGLSIVAAARIARASNLVALGALLRFALPFLTTRLGVLSGRPDLSATVLWAGIAYAASTVAHLAPIFVTHAMLSAEEVTKNDPRKPVLYLRSFDKELTRAPRLRWLGIVRSFTRSQGGYYLPTADALIAPRSRQARALGSVRTPFDEQMVFAQAFERVGPYIAIGRPREGSRDRDLGAAKKYVADDEWQDVILQWLRECAAVVLEAGDSAGLGWEIDQVVRLVPPRRVLLICPYTNEEYDAFLREHGRRFLFGLPAARPSSRLLTFDDTWAARELASVGSDAIRTLSPFVAQVGTNLGVIG